MKLKTKRKLEKAKLFFLFLVFLYGMTAFFVGWHNLDSAQNYEKINQKLDGKCNVSLTEMSLQGIKYDMNELYIIGARQIFIGFFVTLFSAFLIGFKLSEKFRI